MKIAFIVGTRPEIIKVAPVILSLKELGIEYEVINTAQHKDLMDPYWDLFEIYPTHILDVMVPGQNLSLLTAKAVSELQLYIDNCSIKPDIILAQGDTTTVMAASIICFYNHIKFIHLEAGLRSFDLNNPFPEEFNRRVASIIADIHLCPTELAKENLLREKIQNGKIHVVGNTVIDALRFIRSKGYLETSNWRNINLASINWQKKAVLITCHRRENHGVNLLHIIDSIIELAANYEDLNFIWILHPNPNVRNVVLNSNLLLYRNIFLVDPLEYVDILKILSVAVCVISDSGGIQEEAPSFKVPVIVIRETTERPEGVGLGLAFLVGSNKEKILLNFKRIIEKDIDINFSVNPYGDGKSSKRIVEIIKQVKAC